MKKPISVALAALMLLSVIGAGVGSVAASPSVKKVNLDKKANQNSDDNADNTTNEPTIIIVNENNNTNNNNLNNTNTNGNSNLANADASASSDGVSVDVGLLEDGLLGLL